MENTEKIIQNENNPQKQNNPQRNRMRRRFGANKKRVQTNAPKDAASAQTNAQPAPKVQKPQNTDKKPHQNSNAKDKNIKTVKVTPPTTSKDSEPIDFTIGEFEDKDKKYAFKMVKRTYYIVEIIEEAEKELFKTTDSKVAYFEWCKIKYPEKVKKNMI